MSENDNTQQPQAPQQRPGQFISLGSGWVSSNDKGEYLNCKADPSRTKYQPKDKLPVVLGHICCCGTLCRSTCRFSIGVCTTLLGRKE